MALIITNDSNMQTTKTGTSTLQQTGGTGLTAPSSTLPDSQANQDKLMALLRSDANGSEKTQQTNGASNHFVQSVSILLFTVVAIVLLMLYQRLVLKMLNQRK